MADGNLQIAKSSTKPGMSRAPLLQQLALLYYVWSFGGFMHCWIATICLCLWWPLLVVPLLLL